MPAVEATGEIVPASEVLGEIEQALTEGKCARAHQLSLRLGALQTWPGARGVCLAARLAEELGAPKQGRRLRLQAFRHHRSSPLSWPGFIRTVAAMRGPLMAWLHLDRLPQAVSADARTWSELFATRARVAAQLRDFEAARRWLAEAELRTPGGLRVAMSRADVLETEGRFPEALAAAQEALNRYPHFPPAILAKARLLQRLNRKAEALEFLGSAGSQLECGAVFSQVGQLQVDSGQYAEAEDSFARCAALWPLAEKEVTQWLLERRVEAACLGGQFDLALTFARQVEAPLHQELVARLEAGNIEPKRVLLPVPFDASVSDACAPTTLTAICTFWQKPAEHLEAAGQVSADGTTARSERRWAEEHGWCVREFRVTRDSTVALIDLGVPFTLTTLDVSGAHLLTVVGYDALRQTILVRDPCFGGIQDHPAAIWLRHHVRTGPRGMAMVPREQAKLLEELELPESGLYDRLHELFLALQVHDRRKAVEWLAELREIAPAHRLTFEARLLLAGCDGNSIDRMAATSDWLELRPDDVRMQLERLAQLSAPFQRTMRLNVLKGLCLRPRAHPRLLLAYAGELSQDAGEDGTVTRVLRRAARYGEWDGRTAFLLANVLWRQRDLARALSLYRCAASLDEESEEPARAYFAAARYLDRTDEALALLSERFRREGRQSSRPARMLFRAQAELHQIAAALLTLESALEQRPQDADLHSFALEAFVRHGEFDRARALLARSERRLSASLWLRLRARLAGLEGNLLRALELWRRILESEPIAMDAHAAVVDLLSVTESPGAGARHLRLVCARFQNHLGLHELWLRAMRHEPASETGPVLQRVLAIHSDNASVHRELALNLSEQGDFKPALNSARQAIHLEPDNPQSHHVLAIVLARNGHTEESSASARAAVQLSVGHLEAIEHLLRLAGPLENRKIVLALVERELSRQPRAGGTLLTFGQLARGILEPEDLLQALQRIHAARPDLWQASSALILHLLDLQRPEEAMPPARDATERFPLESMVWFHCSLVCRARQDYPAERAALEKAVMVNADCTEAIDALASACERTGDLVRAREVLEAAGARTGFSPQAQLRLAALLWKFNQRDDAMRRVRRLLEGQPTYEVAWTQLQEWAAAMDDPRLPARFALELTENRPGDAEAWLALARRRHAEGNLPDAVAAAARAVRLQSRFIEACDFLAQLRVALKDREAALEACLASGWGLYPPLALRARAFWVEAELGSLPAAVRSMRDLLTVHPEYAPGWNRLAEWSTRLGEVDAAIHAASQLVRLEPFIAGPLVYRAQLRLQRQDRPGAKADLRRALELDRAQEKAATTWFDLLLADGEFESAETLLSHIQQHLPGYLPAACETRLRAERSRKPAASPLEIQAPRSDELQQALEKFRALCLSDLQSVQPLEAAFKALHRSRYEAPADALIQELLHAPGVSPYLGALWARRRVVRKGFGLRDELMGLLKQGEIGRKAMVAYIEELSARSAREPLQHLMTEHQAWLRLDPQAWEAVGLALANLALPDDLLAWTHDWRQHGALSPELRLALVLALRNKGREEEAREAVNGMTSEAARNPAAHRLRVWEAVEAALAGESERGQKALESVDPMLLDDYHRQVSRLARSLLDVQRTSRQNLAEAKRMAPHALERFVQEAKLKRSDVALRRLFRRAVRRLAQDCRRPLLRVWGWTRL